MSFKKIFVISQVCCFLPTLPLVLYMETTRFMESNGVLTTTVTTIAFSMLPAVLIAICWWNYVTPEDE